MAFASTRQRWAQATEPVEPKQKPAPTADDKPKPKRKPRKKAAEK